MRLEGCAWCYRPDVDSPPIDEPPALRNGYVTFGAFNWAAKLTRPVAELWAKVIDAVPDSRLMAPAVAGRQTRPCGAGPADARAARERRSYLDLCRQADVGLDPFPYNGMTTTRDLLCSACRR